MGMGRLLTTATIAVACAAAPVAAVADQAPASPPQVTADSTAPDATAAIRLVIDNIRKLRDTLPPKIEGKRHEQTWFDSGLIFLGLGSVAAALYKSTAPAIGGVALAASGVSQYRTYYNPDAEGLAYITAAKAARCVSSNAEPLLVVQPQLLWSAIANLKLAILQVDASASQLDPGTPAGTDGSDAASKAVVAANSALTALNAEAAAYLMSVSTIDTAHDTIKDYLEKKMHRTSVDFGTVQAQLNAAITAQANSLSQTEIARGQLLSARQASAKAQASSGAAPAPPPVAATPQNLTAANTVQPADAAKAGPIQAKAGASPAAAASVNSQQVSALVEATQAALQQMPTPAYTTIQTNVMACTNGLA